MTFFPTVSDGRAIVPTVVGRGGMVVPHRRKPSSPGSSRTFIVFVDFPTVARRFPTISDGWVVSNRRTISARRKITYNGKFRSPTVPTVVLYPFQKRKKEEG